MTHSHDAPSHGGLSRELLESSLLRDSFLQAAEPGSLWTSEQIEASLAETMRGVCMDDIWVFAYGSLIWNPIFPVAERKTAYVHGFHRAFCLSSPIGRGTRERPGLMLGLASGGSCNGLALKIGGSDVQAELTLLWRREMLSGSYSPRWVNASYTGGKLQALAFVANPARQNYVGRLSDEEAVARLVEASGILGSSLEYLQLTHDGLAANGIPDRHISRLLKLCRASKQVETT